MFKLKKYICIYIWIFDLENIIYTKEVKMGGLSFVRIYLEKKDNVELVQIVNMCIEKSVDICFGSTIVYKAPPSLKRFKFSLKKYI